jgi:hypothetical protein
LDASERAAGLGRGLGDPFLLGYALWVRAVWSMTTGDFDTAYSAARESVEVVRGLADRYFSLAPVSVLAALEEQRGHAVEAERLRLEVRPYLEPVNDRPLFIGLFLGFGIEARHHGRLDEAEAFFRRGLHIARRLRSRQMTTVMESELAHLARERGERQAAKAAYANLIWRWKDLGQISAVAHQLECFALIAMQEGEPARAARLFGAAEALREAIQIFRRSFESTEYQHAVTALRGQMDARDFETAWAAGRAIDMDQAIRYATTPPEAH